MKTKMRKINNNNNKILQFTFTFEFTYLKLFIGGLFLAENLFKM
jgi:hypothetical protein